MARDELAKRRHFRDAARALKKKQSSRTRPGTGEHTMPPKGYRSLGENTTMVSVRLPQSLVPQIDAHVKRMRREHPDLPITRTHAVSNLIRRGLAAEVTDTVTDTTVTAAPLEHPLDNDFEDMPLAPTKAARPKASTKKRTTRPTAKGRK